MLCVHVIVCVCAYVCVCMHACVRVCMHACVHVFMRVHMGVHVYAWCVHVLHVYECVLIIIMAGMAVV